MQQKRGGDDRREGGRGQDGNGLQLENSGPTFSSFPTVSWKNHVKLSVVTVCSPFENSLDLFLLKFQEHCSCA